MAENSEETADARKQIGAGDLPKADSPPLSPAGEVAAAPETSPEPADSSTPTGLVAFVPQATPFYRRLRLQPHHQRYALLAASVAIAAALGIVTGLVAGGAFAPPKRQAVAGLGERHALQRSIGKLNKEVATLKASLAAAEKSAHSQVAKIADRAPDITGSIPAPARAVPMPMPRPAAAVSRPAVVPGWAIRFVRGGYVFVSQAHGDLYRAQLGAPLPGIGPVQEIKRQDGRWLVVTPQGLIVAERDRAYFETF
jgi:hypothetical protein